MAQIYIFYFTNIKNEDRFISEAGTAGVNMRQPFG